MAKHHDSFAFWPTKSAKYNVSESPWKAGKGDMVSEFAKASRKAGLRFGVYCSPWDRNNPLERIGELKGTGSRVNFVATKQTKNDFSTVRRWGPNGNSLSIRRGGCGLPTFMPPLRMMGQVRLK